MDKTTEMGIRHFSRTIATPFYLYDTSRIREVCRRFIQIPITNKSVHFACMANISPEFLKIIKDEHLNTFVNSIGHLKKVLKLGFHPEQIIYAASAMDKKSMSIVHRLGVNTILDSLGQIRQWKALFPKSPFGIRCNIGEFVKPKNTVGGYFIGNASRLGLLPEEVQTIKGDKQVSGLHTYIGTDITDLSYFEDCYDALSQFASYFPNLQYIDFGGGFGLGVDSNSEFDFEKYSQITQSIMLRIRHYCGPHIKMIIEPGRIIGARSAWFVLKVTDVKKRGHHQLIGVNGSSVQFPRPLFYPDSAHHPVSVLMNSERKNHQPKIMSSVYGCSTYSRDFFAQNVMLPPVLTGDIIAIGDAGSYCAAAYTHFLGFPIPKEIFYDSTNYSEQIRKKTVLQTTL